jgi:acetyl-CoA carboxylase biotin carboxyl carrier protein
VSDDLSSLSEEHVRQLGRIIEALERSAFDFLQFEVGELKVTVGKGNIPIPESAAPPAQSMAVAPPAPVLQKSPTAAHTPSAVHQPRPSVSSPQGAIEIKSPIMGMFYAQPEPGAPPFVAVGSAVNEDTTVALIEVMKTFNAVSAGVRGKVVEICAQNGQLVEYGQVLFRVVPE